MKKLVAPRLILKAVLTLTLTLSVSGLLESSAKSLGQAGGVFWDNRVWRQPYRHGKSAAGVSASSTLF